MPEPVITTEKPKLDPPDTKIVKFKKSPGGRWEVTFKGPVRQGDINHLVRAMRVEFNRAKRKLRVESRKQERLAKQVVPEVKEPVNVTESVAA